MQVNDGAVLRYKLWMRLFLIFGVIMWVGILALILTGSDRSLDLAALIIVLFLLPTFVAALSVNLSWLGYDAQGIEQHALIRRPVQIGWVEITGVKMATVRRDRRQDQRFLMVVAPGRRITTSGQYNGFEELVNEIERKVPADRWEKQ